MSLLLSAVLGYVLGAIPFGLLIGRWTRGIDLRAYGSHRTGATNALRTLGPWTLLIVLPIVVAVVWRSRFVSLGSITGALAAAIVTAVLAGLAVASVPAVAYALASGVLVTVSHADNIGRLRAGTERRIGQKEQVGSGG
jgi:glycerol-3-phosphate acyltransferase PlsY